VPRRCPYEASGEFGTPEAAGLLPFKIDVSRRNDVPERTMKIEVHLFASLRGYLPQDSQGNSCVLDVEEGTKVGEIPRKLNIPGGASKVIFLNGVHAHGDEVLQKGDRVGVFPPVAGG
jgi:molybdopterin synthase sulfur carrier subunit